MKVGYSFWGYLTPFEKNTVLATPDGERGNRVDFVDEMLSRGHEVVRLQVQRDDEPYKNVTTHATDGFPDVDVAYFEWRWPTWKNKFDARNQNPAEPDYKRQMDCLWHYHMKGVPIIIHDGDLKMTPEDELAFPNAILADACVNPRVQTRPRITLPWCNYTKRRLKPVEYSYNYTYVGNNYERDAQFSKYYSAPSKKLRENGIQTSIYGNWLERSPERKDPRILISENPNISFGGRLAYNQIFDVINKSVAVTHITKDEYTPYGNITGRFLETIMAGTIALVPKEYTHAKSVGLSTFLVNNLDDVEGAIRMISLLSVKTKEEIISSQEQALRKIVDIRPEYRVDVIESVAKGTFKV
jgi:hypothetical protein